MSHIRSVRWGVPVRETLVLSHRLCEAGSPVPIAAFTSPVFPPGPHLLLGGQWVGNQPLALCGSRTVVFATGSKRSNRYATHHEVSLLSFTTSSSYLPDNINCFIVYALFVFQCILLSFLLMLYLRLCQFKFFLQALVSLYKLNNLFLTWTFSMTLC